MTRDINSETAEKIMGWHPRKNGDDFVWKNEDGVKNPIYPWRPDWDMNQAKIIIEKMNDMGYTLSVEQSITNPKQFKVTFSYYKDGKIAVMGTAEDREGNLAKAICLAALDTFENHEDYWTTPEGIEQSR